MALSSIIFWLVADETFQTAQEVSSSYDATEELFECIACFIARLKIYAQIQRTKEMREVIIKTLAEIISVLAIATKQVKKGRICQSSVTNRIMKY